jgi:hypothetical protein
MPVRITSPFGSTTSIPHWADMSAPYGMYVTPWSSVFPTTLPQPRSATESMSLWPPALIAS